MAELRLPLRDRTLEMYSTGDPAVWPRPGGPSTSRVAFAATHVVMDPLAHVQDPMADGAIDWDATMAFRHYLWSLGLGVADAMDTAQRGQGLGWDQARRLIERSSGEARSVGGALVCGATTDQLEGSLACTLDQIARAYTEQCDFIEEAGAVPIVMASQHLARTADGPSDYLRVYDAVLRDRGVPVMLHWLGAPFVPAFGSYWGSSDTREASRTLLELISRHVDRVAGVKLSVLDRDLEIDLRRRLPPGVRLFTGDDFNYVDLIRGDGTTHSDALLGVFDPIAPAAAAALAALDADDVQAYDTILSPTLPLARTIFEAPTGNYKVGVVLLAYLNGHQAHFRMLGGMEATRSLAHLADVFRAADTCGLLRDPEMAVARMKVVLAVAGVE